MKDESIFPQGVAISGGMSQRAYFAIKILQSMVSAENKKDKPAATTKNMVADAINFADSLLEALDGKD
jgi:hypothetical protein